MLIVMVVVEEVTVVNRSKLLWGGVMVDSLFNLLLLDFTLLQAFFWAHLLSTSSPTSTSPLILSSQLDNSNDHINNLHLSKPLLPLQTPHLLCGLVPTSYLCCWSSNNPTWDVQYNESKLSVQQQVVHVYRGATTHLHYNVGILYSLRSKSFI